MSKAMTIREACSSVADDIESGKLVPGTRVYDNKDGSPCCTIGHIKHRAGSGRVGDVECFLERAHCIIDANDQRNWREVVRQLRMRLDETDDDAP